MENNATKKLSHPEILGVICSLIMIISVFLPWYVTTIENYSLEIDETDTYYGYTGDAMFLLIFGILSLISIYIGYMKNKRAISGIAVSIFGLLALWIVLSLIIRMDSLIQSYNSELSFTNLSWEGNWVVGAYIGILGVLGLLVSGFWLIYEGMRYSGGRKEELVSEEIPPEDIPIKTLKLRYAKGEISKEDYAQMKKDLEK